jgi:hypothetical protein
MRVRATTYLPRHGLAAALLALPLAAAPAAAQVFFEPFSYRFQVPLDRGDDADAAMRPREAADAARAQGLDPTSRPTLNREVYVFDAQDRAGRPVRVIMDAYEGEILRVMPRIDGARRAPGSAYGRPADAPSADALAPDDARARPRRDARVPPAMRKPKREATLPAPTVVPSPPPAAIAPSDRVKPVETVKPTESARTPDAAPARPAAVAPPLANAPMSEEPGPIPSPPFASGAYSKPPAPQATATPSPMPPVTPLDDVKPKIKAAAPVPPAPLE